MGMNESSVKLLTELVNNLIGNCGHSDCKSECGDCFELGMDAGHALPAIQPRGNGRDNMSSSITEIVERHETRTHIKTTNA